ncbi:MAG: large subunit ribosomal protein, partial [Candidatus Eremiobacteraeota bacterium]|nr:large subunit ribosomal protein [Candidatus Eremiobacteraeota bacterium]
MSRIGRKAVTVPSGVTANVEGQTVKVKGPKGSMQVVLPG